MPSSFSSALISPDASASEQSRKDMQAKLNGIDGMSGKNMSPEAKAKKLREACEGFESIFIQKMWQEMRNAIPKSGLMQAKEERFWQDMYDKELATSMSKAGGIGLADMMYEQLSQNLGSVSRTTADASVAPVFVPSAAPLVVAPAPAMEPPADTPAAETIYDGEAPDIKTDVEEPVTPAGPTKAELLAERDKLRADAKLEADMNLIAQQAARVAAKAREPKKEHIHNQLPNEGSINLAYLAGRDAGDKLSSGAVRPALKPRKTHKVDTPAETAAPVSETPKPGSAEALRNAVELAKTGAVPQEQATTASLNELVAQVQAKNAALRAAGTADMQAISVASAEHAVQNTAPATRKVTYTTNIPQNRRSKKNEQAIRMLNVDNVSVNSKAGKGLAAYHAQQDAVAQTAVANPENISPLKASSASNPAATAVAAGTIPPLRAMDI